jgi:hypothetical protein
MLSDLNQREMSMDQARQWVDVRAGVLWKLGSNNLCPDRVSASVRSKVCRVQAAQLEGGGKILLRRLGTTTQFLLCWPEITRIIMWTSKPIFRFKHEALERELG